MKNILLLISLLFLPVFANGQDIISTFTPNGIFPVAQNSRVTIKPRSGLSFSNCTTVASVNPPATEAGNCRVLWGGSYATLISVSTSQIDLITPNGYGTKQVFVQYFDAGDNYWYTSVSEDEVSVWDHLPALYEYEVSGNFYLYGELWSTTNGSTYTFDKYLSASGNNPASKNGYPTIVVFYYTGADANVDLIVNGDVNNTIVTYKGASGYSGINQVNFYLPSPSSGSNFALRRNNTAQPGTCGDNCNQSYALFIQNHTAN